MNNALTADDIRSGRLYRGKKPKRAGIFSNEWDDRVVLWISSDRTIVQYDSYAVRNGCKYPKSSMEKFLQWVDRELPAEAEQSTSFEGRE